MRSMQKARPMTRARATSDINPALPSINFTLSSLCSPPPSSGTTSSTSASANAESLTNSAADESLTTADAGAPAAIAAVSLLGVTCAIATGL